MHEVHLAPEPAAVQTARATVTGLGLPDPPERTATLLVSELVSNAVQHADLGPDERITVRTDVDGRVRVEVCDPGMGFEPAPRTDDLEEPGGWGLVLVESLAEDWGIERERGQTCVWFEFGLGAAA